ncbi:MAG: ImmA/IrrE family metallo-endopeptidase [Lachnospiraceae bacterium]|nr:ImmA/IrrE family metallo-endopeptidase [Lachnospiraceae bacterium]
MDDRLFSIPEKLISQYNTRDPFIISHEKGFTVKYLDLKKQKGFCTNIYNNYFIFINENLSEQMKKMTCAHELGHIIFHKDKLARSHNGSFKKLIEMELFDIKDNTEYEANLFAANLLIDTDEMMNLLKEGYDIVHTASTLDVNVNMLAIKLLEMPGMDLKLPFTVNRKFLGSIGDSADSVQ